ncbi:bifunctional proline dehydrogenase/pyrroline-5-carboxylate dehydrogenase [Ehrlichia ruminantium]|uniref:bifunctional proline dehydrogenase/L-glutamate gamma-semialdehyde dehydrogenase PutA n=1 Tax=Ehrlichia ruminantium TaxID=779 RepID=UPI0007C10DA7|nr:bifunctional proline dehydrogenase/L-glutamate gamma-semialdehyde dehydrogenase PutA [Ehrlichia ruminantium]QLK52311.1 bifunctional proline dehydrogenase/L-glutamate gamma-semialdehyde dehydrogenase PutA [Ehrlichia ruminantium]QLK54141.1 bifunctional proline dehydrogenase/L-glutamate gamma-semialdehyde dehydrogenase PutA [Ehrlichia ruminantium]QLK56893.1 bifunctional proline dehydrogenase/L-glutamate gamma-semialdehyde dehydrogenase PutA [Ehrlichia ruminantium]GAT76215.1 bifunctional proline
MISALQVPNEIRRRMQLLYRTEENSYARYLTEKTEISQDSKIRIYSVAKQIIEKIRGGRNLGIIDAFMQEYGLSNEEGIALMCLAESLLRVPDDCTINDLIKDKIANSMWSNHIGNSSSMFVNAATWGLFIGGRVLKDTNDSTRWFSTINNLIKTMGEPIIRKAVQQAMYVLGKHFIKGRDIIEAIGNRKESELYSFDILGEASKTKKDAERYFTEYMKAIDSIGKSINNVTENLVDHDEISVKISALHNRYEFSQINEVLDEIVDKLLSICRLAKQNNIRVCIDAEEASRLEISLMILEKLRLDSSLDGWEGLGLAVQAYQKRAFSVLDFVEDIAVRSSHKMMIRLVKGAYWDYEIKNAQELGLSSYPVFTRKVYTDVSYLACAYKILTKQNTFYPCFATHNAYTLATILEIADKDHPGFEFQRLHGMGTSLYEYVTQEMAANIKCRVYAPVGSYQDLLPYLIRRLLENGANSSFINQMNDSNITLDQLIEDPLEKAKSFEYMPHPSISLPKDIFGDERINSAGIDITDSVTLVNFNEEMKEYKEHKFKALSIINGEELGSQAIEVFSPANSEDVVGEVSFADATQAVSALDIAYDAFKEWSSMSVYDRAAILEKAADLMEENKAKLIVLLIREGGKVISDAIAEVREAVDFLRYYVAMGKKELGDSKKLPGPVGEDNYIYFRSRGVFICISPWNFPLAIFIGPIVAALITGNTVLAKPAEQTSIIAYEAVKLLYDAGVPKGVLHLLLGHGKELGEVLLKNEKIAGVAFTGSTETARIINQAIAEKEGAIIPFIAETGGLNTMIVDSSALIEQVTNDVIASAFKSAGQRCSALRVLFVQEEIADKQIEMICGAMEDLVIGDPMLLKTDIGPVIDDASREMLFAHADRMSREGKLLCKVNLGEDCEKGYFFPPCAYEIESISQLNREVFGPILHIIRYKKGDLHKILTEINNTGYGLTFAVQSRIQSNIDNIIDNINVGNVYVNRNQVGAVVGVQPFGGQGLSGTGPKAGGPYYLHRFLTEKVISINTTALGGNTTLMCLNDE